ncbi:MAG: DUF3810 domain-containing protein [Lachnospiraceae bacterium]|nr:DUF3810 domain-containing protein [Lachnospiraceae bacterium]
MKKKKITLAIFILLLNILAWSSRSFCDWYIAHIFPIWVNTYGRLTGLFPFSVGEWMIVAGLLLVMVAIVLGIVWGVRSLIGKIGKSLQTKGEVVGDKSRAGWGFDRFCRGFYGFFTWVLLGVGLVMTLNCVMLYHASTFSEKYLGETGEYTLEELLALRNHIVEQCNGLSEKVQRQEDGTISYPGSTPADGSSADMKDKAREAMQELGDQYPQLDGYYPRPKPLFFSDFMCQQYMCGYYFPFSMEANYNDVMYVMNKPATLCHELAHLRGYIYEDEANFIGYLACIGSDDIYFQYAGYLSVLVYVENDVYRAYAADPEAFAHTAEKTGLLEVLPQVWEDNVFVEKEEWERINKKALIETETVDRVTNTLVDTSLKANGVSDGKVSYSRVVSLLLQYYRRKDF